jgi:predicted acetyltransferase
MMELVQPAIEHVPSYVEALNRGWSPDRARGEVAAREHLEAVEKDPVAFVGRLTDREAKGLPVTLPDGSKVPRLPGYVLWMWDGEFSGLVGLRWQPGTVALPAHVLGHIGYVVVPWKQKRGYATRALGLVLPRAREEGLEYVELTTEPENLASQKVMRAHGAVFVEKFMKTASQGGNEALRFRISLKPS